jgi:phosphopantothenoylcysteine decarboxylase/phosphopantothenate--cysteine ligase
MNINLKNKSVLLGVTGSISAYKACDLARLFVKAGAKVRVVMTPSAEKFVSPLTFEALTRNSVLTSESESWASNLNHIDIGKESDIFIIAPATANSLNKISKGIADNILLESALAFRGEIILAPSANTQMLENHYTRGSIKMLEVNDYTIVKSQTKVLACGDNGDGALADVEDIFYVGVRALLKDDFWNERRVVVTGGATKEKIDEVRYISNYSSGKMANSLALSLYLKGADVCYLSTNSHNLPKDIYSIDVESSEEMLDYTKDAIRVAKKPKVSKASLNNSDRYMMDKKPYLFMVSAVSDYTPKFAQKGKLKKSMIGENWSIECVQTQDILSNIDKDGIHTVAFKAEMDIENGEQNAINLLSQKDVEAVCYNHLDSSNSFGTDDNIIKFITKNSIKDLGKASKIELSFKILDEAKTLIDE